MPAPFSSLPHEDAGPRRHALVEIDDVLEQQPDAAARHRPTDRSGIHVAVQAIERVLAVLEDVERPRSERVVEAGRHAVRILGEFGLPLDHLPWRRPLRPFALIGDAAVPAPAEAVASDPDAIA